MTTYSPTYITLTEHDLSTTVTITTEQASEKVIPELISYRKENGTLHISTCAQGTNIISVRPVEGKSHSFVLHSTESGLQKMKECSSVDPLALRFIVEKNGGVHNTSFSAQEAIIVPIYNEIGSPLLKSAAVLGDTTSYLATELSCGDSVITERKPIQCSLKLKNLLQNPVLVTSYSKPSFEMEQSTVVENLLLLAGQETSVNFEIKDTHYYVGNHTITLISGVSSISGNGSTVSIPDEFSFSFLPWYVLVLMIGLISGFFVILSRKSKHKLSQLLTWIKNIRLKRRK